MWNEIIENHSDSEQDKKWETQEGYESNANSRYVHPDINYNTQHEPKNNHEQITHKQPGALTNE